MVSRWTVVCTVLFGLVFGTVGLLVDPARPLDVTYASYAFLSLQPDGSGPVTWDPCAGPVSYVIRPDDEPPGGERLVADAFATLASATGLEFRYAGRTSEVYSEYRDPVLQTEDGISWAPVLVSWQTEAENPELEGTVVGTAGSQTSWDEDGDARYVTGVVNLDAPTLTHWLATGRADDARTVVLHELGHLAGLDHVRDPGQVMNPSTGTVHEYSAGDLAGLARLGEGPCSSRDDGG